MARAERQRALASGARAESLAATFLESNGLCVVARNVRSRFGEIDLVCRDGDTLVFVEVRLRRSPRYGGAAESITAAKRARLVAACESYLATLPRTPACRIDAILVDALDARRIEWMRDAVSV
jgi:putative endonuclease